MPSDEVVPRPHVTSIRLSEEENEFCAALIHREGIDKAGAFRKGMLDYGRSVGLEFPLKRKLAAPPQRKGR